MTYRVCEPVAKYLRKIGKLTMGQEAGAVTLGPSLTLAFLPLDEKAERHEAMHRRQAERFRPWWGRGPLRRWGTRAAMAGWLAAYVKEWSNHGYDNKFEREARAAEDG